jgi:hypothetical protein
MLWRVPSERRPARPLDQARRLPCYLDADSERIAFEQKLALILLETGEPRPAGGSQRASRADDRLPFGRR